MDEGASRITSPGRVPRLLIAADYVSTLEPLLHTFRDDRLDIDFDLSSSHTSAVSKLLTGRYQLIMKTGLHQQTNCLTWPNTLL
jgi:hypothetical protein